MFTIESSRASTYMVTTGTCHPLLVCWFCGIYPGLCDSVRVLTVLKSVISFRSDNWQWSEVLHCLQCDHDLYLCVCTLIDLPVIDCLPSLPACQISSWMCLYMRFRDGSFRTMSPASTVRQVQFSLDRCLCSVCNQQSSVNLLINVKAGVQISALVP